MSISTFLPRLKKLSAYRDQIVHVEHIAPREAYYGELDKPGPDNASAAYNETVEPALAELRSIYKAFDAEDKVSLRVTRGRGHEFEIEDLVDHFK